MSKNRRTANRFGILAGAAVILGMLLSTASAVSAVSAAPQTAPVASTAVQSNTLLIWSPGQG